MQPKLAHVKLSDITLIPTNKMFRDESEMTEDALKELIDSVYQLGVIQPVLLRPAPELSPFKFELIAGERRFRASLAAGKATIPANIQEPFNVQVTENLQRKDIHPLKEAFAYKYLVDKDPANTPAELALKFAKTEHYIQTRLKLNDMVDEAKTDFKGGLMGIGHALLLARLTPEDQLIAIKHHVRTFSVKKETKRVYESVNDLQEYIDENILSNLSSAAFKKDDETLLPKAGPCTTCPKRSGANQLFDDIHEKDRCFDPKCFLEKRIRYVAMQIPVLIEKKPDQVFLSNSQEANPEIKKLLKEYAIIPLKEDSDFYAWSCSKTKVKGLWISGEDVGKFETVWLKSKGSNRSSAGGGEKVSKKEAITRINERLIRFSGLDEGKVYSNILDALGKHPTQQKPDIKYYNPAEDAFRIFMIWERLVDKEGLLEELGHKVNDEDEYEFTSEKLFKIFSEMDTADSLFIMRKAMLETYRKNQSDSPEAYFIREIAKGYKDIPVDEFEADQQVIREKRESNAAKRIAEIEAPKKKKPAKAKKTHAEAK